MITGGCLCGAVRFKASEAPITARVCWCRACQSVGAGSGTVNAVFRKEAFTIDGVMADYASVADSGTRMHRHFCSTCGTHLLSLAESRPHLVVVRVGALDDPERAKPACTVWTAGAPSWACIDPALPAFEGQAPPADLVRRDSP